MRRQLIAVLAVTAAAGLTAPTAMATTAWCSESGDSCYRTFKANGKRYVSINYAAQYKTKERLCVLGPDGERNCVTAKLRRGKFDQWSVRLQWSRHFPNHGAGTYTFESPSPDPLTFRIK